MATNVKYISPVVKDSPDHFFILSASWESRCIATSKASKNYSAQKVLVNIYDKRNELREYHLKEMRSIWREKGQEIIPVKAYHHDPIDSVNYMIAQIKSVDILSPKITIDISCFTRKHLLQLLHGLDSHSLLDSVQLYYTDQVDYDTIEATSSSIGIDAIDIVETFNGELLPSRDTILIIFLNYEGRRALALWQQIEPHLTIPVIPHPPYQSGWLYRTENQNRLLLSSICSDKNETLKVDPLSPIATENFLEKIILKKNHPLLKSNKDYNFIVAPLGTKPQIIGVFNFFKKNEGLFSIMYPTPTEYKNKEESFPAGNIWLIN